MNKLIAIFLCLFTLSFNGFASELKGVRIWPSPDSTRVVLDLTSAPVHDSFLLTGPDRIVVDINGPASKFDLTKIKNTSPLLKTIRTSTPKKKGTFRLVFDLHKATKPVIFSLTPTKPYGHRLVIDLPHNNIKSTKEVSAKKPVVPPSLNDQRDIVIAVDAGHGGDDPGALGKQTYEKHVTLAIAKRVAELINREKGMKAVLIRSGDYFVNLNKRSEIARKSQADLLISIHADGFHNPKPRGASVWVLSTRRANSEIGRWIEKHEEQSELLGGAGEVINKAEQDLFLTRTLLDMSMDHSMNTGYGVSVEVLKELGKVTTLHKKRPEHASLAVLKSPDIPSLLVEAGFITNRQEEVLLRNTSHQKKVANAVYAGVKRHFANNPPVGTYFAAIAAKSHVVQRGESLSVIAKRYGVSVNQLKLANQLKSDQLRVDQELKIPSS
ncbi:N-acetylmuramoyl-L-alanine amidase [Motilimonas cestriensis]|uniref:N-acetylmuramoyl-L-alanine amidase n=1 Tax=Motilimonas cestriensis TaxID=2742685 RepID=A0ABS8WAB7_9GAMM|nr:N-acetylmuramoyl-L-alanine amidase [Motilimonas cestriensis]MCE2595163.1 N-acetylmuramoyl-L-alanine amidase [Motilimonas cestriensis]